MYIMAGGHKVASIRYPQERNKNKLKERINYYHNDILGSTIAITDGDGKVQEVNIYGPFGETEFSYKATLHKIQPEKRAELLVDPFLYSSDNRYMYTGQEQDEFGGLIYYNARWYDPEVGRFISEDPAAANPNDPLTINRYIYCRNNPLIYVDPSGEFFAEILSVFGPIGTLIGAVVDAVIVNYAINFAVNAIAGEMERSGDKRGAQFLRNAYTAYVVISTVVNVINSFESVAKTADGMGSQAQADVNQVAEQTGTNSNAVNGDSIKSGDMTKIEPQEPIKTNNVTQSQSGIESDVSFRSKVSSKIKNTLGKAKEAWKSPGVQEVVQDFSNDMAKGSLTIGWVETIGHSLMSYPNPYTYAAGEAAIYLATSAPYVKAGIVISYRYVKAYRGL
jgi:RHS repeat-associated protein